MGIVDRACGNSNPLVVYAHVKTREPGYWVSMLHLREHPERIELGFFHCWVMDVYLFNFALNRPWLAGF